MSPDKIEVGDFSRFKKGPGQFAEFLALLPGLLGHLQILLGFDQLVEGLGYAKGQFVRSPLDFLFLCLSAGPGGLGIVIGLQTVKDELFAGKAGIAFTLEEFEIGERAAGGKAVGRLPVKIRGQDQPGKKFGPGRLVIRRQLLDFFPAGGQDRVVFPGQR